MISPAWTAVDDYLTELYVPTDPALERATVDSAAAGLPAIALTPPLGKLLHLLARMSGARRVLELGTLGGYSAIWLGRAVPAGGQVVTLELNPKHAEVARSNIARAGLSGAIEVVVGPAAGSLARMVAERAPAFDFVFIDADKPGYPEYLDWVLKLSRPGTVLVADNVVRDGAVARADSTDANVRAVRVFHERLAANPRVSATTAQTVGSKGYDGFAVAVVLEPEPR